MKNKYLFVAVMLLVLMLAGVCLTNIYVSVEKKGREEQEFHVVTSFYPMYIAAENIVAGCEGVILQNLSEPQTGCMHDYQLTAEDMKVLSNADAFAINGGGIETFMSDVAGRYPQLAVIDACERLRLREDNAHAWMSIADYMVQVQTIADGLSALDTEHQKIYQKNCSAYLAKLEILYEKQQEIAEQSAACNVVIFHEAFAYTAEDFGMTITGSMDLDEERQISAGEAADIIAQIQEHNVRLILAEELYGKEMCEMVKKETEVAVIYLDTCVRGSYKADSYLEAMDKNLELIRQFLNKEL